MLLQNILLSLLQYIPACHADPVQCFLGFTRFKREHDTECFLVGHLNITDGTMSEVVQILANKT